MEPVSPEHVHHAILEVFRRRQARTADDLRPKLRARLVEAIEASGLSREDYVLAVRAHDEAIERGARRGLRRVGARTAKREALRRAFEASGETLAEFAEMYGMDPAEVAPHARRARPAASGDQRRLHLQPPRVQQRLGVAAGLLDALEHQVLRRLVRRRGRRSCRPSFL